MKEKPLLLALDTSHRKGSVAVSRGEEPLCEIIFDASDTHSATLMPAVDLCLRTAGVELREIDRFAVVAGPGSFTGLRIGLSTVKAFACIGKRPVAAVSSLETLAAALPYLDDPLLPLIDARRGEIYAALYDLREGFPRELVAPLAVKPAALGKVLTAAGAFRPVVACGTGIHKYGELLVSLLPSGSRFLPSPWSIPSAALVAGIALRKGFIEYDSLPTLEPIYLRPPDAKVPGRSKLRKTRGENGCLHG
ncbi:MAG: tRNA (adenosine(37)-N6)-threonylcarbamoyltransferase complex dimerization subunit type 1 TsaB [Candidatus Krumholzibacteriota bacterium]|nr:tRNA (adenosine(37)-N6)-threonylcarbamoyltransferase complex dimerization subunit type 1 TsaB [Candidatus Krumholzibacteriota bacterium]